MIELSPIKPRPHYLLMLLVETWNYAEIISKRRHPGGYKPHVDDVLRCWHSLQAEAQKVVDTEVTP